MTNFLPDTRLFVASRTFADGPRLPVVDPWSFEVLATVTMADAQRAEEASAAASVAFRELRELPAHKRRDALRAVARSIASRREDLAGLIAREAGKPITFARAEVDRAVCTFELGAEEATRVGGELVPLDGTASGEHHTGHWVRVPAGPVFAISPFNFPLNLVAHKVAPALACGCSVVLKPPPQAPLTSLALAAIVRDACPVENALQVMPCANEVAEACVAGDGFATLSFTGSARVGWHLKSLAGRKRVLLELGGNAAAIVHADADLGTAGRKIAEGAFGYAGQVCIKVQRLYVHRAIAGAVVDDVVKRAGAFHVGAPMDQDTVVGPMIDEANARRVEAWVGEAVSAGARILVGGGRDRNRVAATVIAIDGSGAGLKAVDEEVFGPVLTVHVYDEWNAALAMADATRYGLQAGIFTDSQARIQSAFRALHVGALIVNDVPTFRVDSMPYGGTRDSGIGREGVRFAIEEMTERKLLVMRGVQ
jgi:acyl-CoA reductase-like NAD-dependent aldehyde dehydrogenase